MNVRAKYIQKKVGISILEVLKIVGTLIFSYLIGSILSGEIVARCKKVNVREQGSGNVGATNVCRSMGFFYGSLVLAGDMLKGIIAVIFGNILGEAYGIDLGVLAGITVITGHNWSFLARFRGGKGIATSLGVAIALTPLTLIILLPVWLILFLLSGFVSLASIVAVVVYPLTVFFLYGGALQKLLFAIILAVLAIYRHKSNIGRLFRKEENRFIFKNRKDANKR
ncbi:MAG: glycerol-3-phosphate 1-O-acyltransferase PlsY [Bacillota bacterium]